MKILLSSLGSRGDVQPFLALAVGLQRAGHQVTFAIPPSFTEWIESYGIRTHRLTFNPQDMMNDPEMQTSVKSRNVFKQLRLMREKVGPGIATVMDEYWQAAPEADFLLQTGTGFGAIEGSIVYGLPVMLSFVQPFHVTRAFPSFFLPFRFSLGGAYNLLTHQLLFNVLSGNFIDPVNIWRRKINLPPLRSIQEMLDIPKQHGAPTLYGFSPNVIAKPADWDDFKQITGYWFLDPLSDWQPPADLLKFLESGSPPVYIGFGSMRDEDPERMTQMILRALAISGQRGILLTGWGGLKAGDTPDHIFFVDNVPHAWLFPRMAAVVHHGGAGTTSAGVRAGVPSLIAPFALDQYAWAERIVRLGVGPKLPEAKRLTAETLAQAITQAMTDSAMRARAAALSEKVRAENGIERAVEIIERHAADHKQRTTQ